MKIGIPLSRHAYTPEAYAYEKYLSNLGWKVQLDYALDPNNDLNLMFMGVDPFWKKGEGRALIVHEYQSLSIPPYSYLKDLLKKTVNRKPSGRIFLNNIVHSNLSFKDNVPYIYRDMGVDEIFFQTPNLNPHYDIVYCGSIHNRVGLVECLLKLVKLGYKVIVVGDANEDMKSLFSGFQNMTFFGRASRSEIADIYKNAKFGLNYTPNVFPFNVQTSTKTLEYLASGLRVISNKYCWSIQLSESFDIMWLNDFLVNKNNYNLNESAFDRNNKILSWDELLTSNGFEDFLKSCVNV